MKPLADNINNLVRALYTQNGGKDFAEIMISWPKIVGPKYAAGCWPLKISNQTNDRLPTTLHIGAANASIGTELSYSQNLIIEKIAIYLGKKLIEKVTITIRNT